MGYMWVYKSDWIFSVSSGQLEVVNSIKEGPLRANRFEVFLNQPDECLSYEPLPSQRIWRKAARMITHTGHHPQKQWPDITGLMFHKSFWKPSPVLHCWSKRHYQWFQTQLTWLNSRCYILSKWKQISAQAAIINELINTESGECCWLAALRF